MEQTCLDLQVRPKPLKFSEWEKKIVFDGSIFAEVIYSDQCGVIEVTLFYSEDTLDNNILKQRNELNKEKSIKIVSGELTLRHKALYGSTDILIGGLIIATIAKMTTTLAVELRSTTGCKLYDLLTVIRNKIREGLPHGIESGDSSQ